MTDDALCCLSYWFPLIERAGLPVPKTEIVHSCELVGLLDGEKPDGFNARGDRADRRHALLPPHRPDKRQARLARNLLLAGQCVGRA